MNSKILCSVCHKPLNSDLSESMYYWGTYQDEAPVIIAHKITCDPRGKWIFSRDVMPILWKSLNRK
jgi:hypothetical protein